MEASKEFVQQEFAALSKIYNLGFEQLKNEQI